MKRSRKKDDEDFEETGKRGPKELDLKLSSMKFNGYKPLDTDAANVEDVDDFLAWAKFKWGLSNKKRKSSLNLKSPVKGKSKVTKSKVSLVDVSLSSFIKIKLIIVF